jgi:O-antigen ligase
MSSNLSDVASSFGRVATALIACVLALGWLLPNHHWPWPAFHTDAWVAAAMLIMLWLVLVLHGQRLQVSAVSVVAFGLALIPLLQWTGGQISLLGDAVVSSAYLYGFALAVVLGEVVARRDASQATAWIWLAVALAALISVAIQLNQWTGGTEGDTPLDIWVMYLQPGMRPYGNLGQPNQLATLLVWGVIALLWGWWRGALPAWVVGSAGLFLVFGLALTQSRTGWLSLFVLVVLACIWRKREFGRPLLKAVAWLYLAYLVFLVGQPYVADVLGFPVATSMVDRLKVGLGSDLRWQAWAMLLEASSERPWLGYGWAHTREAWFDVAPSFPALQGVQFAHAHNLPLDLIVWVGWPLGVLLTGAACWWATMQMRGLKTAGNALAYAALVVMCIHALLEFPLHYAYFLLPAGVLVGALNSSNPGFVRWLSIGRSWVLMATLAGSVLLAVIIRDYFHVEKAFFDLRLESQRVGTKFNREPPDTWILRPWHDFIAISRMEPHAGMSDEELLHWQALLMYFPSGRVMDKYMQALEVNARKEEAAYFRERFCALMERSVCLWMRNRWAAAAGVPAHPGAADLAPAPLGRAVPSSSGVSAVYPEVGVSAVRRGGAAP